MADKMYVAAGMGEFDTRPWSGLRYADSKWSLDIPLIFDRARRYMNAGCNQRRVERTAFPDWDKVGKILDWPDPAYMPLFEHYIDIIHQPWQGDDPPGPGATVLVDIFCACSEKWMYNTANYDKARQMMRAFLALGKTRPWLLFSPGNEMIHPHPSKGSNGGEIARNFMTKVAYPEFVRAGIVPFCFGAKYLRVPDKNGQPGGNGPIEFQSADAEKFWSEDVKLSIHRPVHKVRDSKSEKLIDTIDF